MAKVPGIWRTRSKVSEAELQADRHRTEERLAAIFGMKFESLESDAGFGADADPETATESTVETATPAIDIVPPKPEPEPEAAPPPTAGTRPRPAIFVEGSRDLVPVMATMEDAPRNGGPHEDWDEAEPVSPVAAADDGPVARMDAVVAAPEPEGPVTAPAKSVTAPVKAVKPKAVAPPVKPKAVAPPAMAAIAPAEAVKPKPVAAPPKPKVVAVPAKAVKPKAGNTAKKVAAPAAWCPSCAIELDPVPMSSRRCVQCRERIVVKRVEGRTVLLAESVLPMFEAERRRVANASRLARECQRWLRLAAIAGAPAEKLEARARSAVARPSEEAVASSRVLYLATVERAYQEAKRERRWEEASRIRRDHALVLHREAGSPVPPSDAVLKLHRDAMAAALRGIAEMVRDAELVAAACCDACRADDRWIVRISTELRAPSLPHEACPKGLCSCHWDLPSRHKATVQRYARRRALADARGPRDQASPTG